MNSRISIVLSIALLISLGKGLKLFISEKIEPRGIAGQIFLKTSSHSSAKTFSRAMAEKSMDILQSLE